MALTCILTARMGSQLAFAEKNKRISCPLRKLRYKVKERERRFPSRHFGVEVVFRRS